MFIPRGNFLLSAPSGGTCPSHVPWPILALFVNNRTKLYKRICLHPSCIIVRTAIDGGGGGVGGKARDHQVNANFMEIFLFLLLLLLRPPPLRSLPHGYTFSSLCLLPDILPRGFNGKGGKRIVM